MNVNKIKLIHFRNFLEVSLDFDDSLNIFIGDNAQGKTNIIESIYTLLRGSSYRTKDEYNLINWHEKQSYLLGEAEKEREHFQINILLQNIDKLDLLTKRIKKIIKVNKKYQRRAWLKEKFYPVIFTPEDLQIIKSTPSIRRKFLDEIIINLTPVYEQYIKNYNRVLYQRNVLLKTERNKNSIDKHLSIWDKKIVELGTLIIRHRIKVLQLINKKVKDIHQLLTKNKETLKLKYNSNVLTSFTEDKQEIEVMFQEILENNKEKDYRLKMTTVGPHRDDYSIMSNSVNLGIYGSQGQQRTAVLALKIAELEMIKEKDQEYPPLLLDDVLSELDSYRKLFLIQLIKERPLQTFITSIDLHDLTQYDFVKHSKIFKVKNGMVEEQ
ncbi:MAG: DNA replication/repair protein RecF [Atribacterota bacterium]|nr:DNA replication/repair protein RecF [Atribacterota bacterium]